MRIIAYVVAALLLFAGCAQDQPKEPAPTAKPSPTATVPSMPAAAQENTVAGAVAFVEHYIDVFNYASNTGDVKELQKLSAPDCEGCSKYIDLIKETYGAGGYFRDSGWSVSSAKIDSAATHWGVLTKVRAPASEYQKDRMSAPTQAPADAYDLYFHVKSGTWVDLFTEAEIQ